MRNPKNIRAFLAVARSGSIGRSAAFLQRTQSAVSRSVQELEREFGVALFERHPHGMELATCGRVLLPRAAAAFAEMEADEKHRISHRGRAFRALAGRLGAVATTD